MHQVVKEAYPDHTALDPGGKYYDEKSTEEKPRWFMVDVELVRLCSPRVSVICICSGCRASS